MIDTMNARAEERARIAALMAEYRGKVTELQPAGELPRTPRSTWVDPDAKLRRNDRYIQPMHANSADKDQQRRELYHRRKREREALREEWS